MKTIALLPVLFLAGVLQAQYLSISPLFENTNIASKPGVTAAYTFANRFSLGGFYEHRQAFLESAEQPFMKQEKTFYGATLCAPINESFDFNLRVGLSDNHKVMVSPAVWGYLRVFKNLDWGLGIGARDFHPSMQTSLRLKLAFQN